MRRPRFALDYHTIRCFIGENIEGRCTAPTAAKGVAVAVLGYIAVITTLLQFLVRARAIFFDNRLIQWVFTFLWLAAAGGNSLLISGATSGICNSDYTFYVPVIFILVHDSCVFLAISYRIYGLSIAFPHQGPVDLSSAIWEGRNRFKIIEMLWGRNLPSVTKALLFEGQLYYLLSVWYSVSPNLCS